MLARSGKKVLIIDCDPQCNLTGMVMGFDHLNDTSTIEGPSNESPRNVRDGLAPAFESRPSLIQAVKCIQVRGNDNLFLLPGHIGLAEYEVTLGISQELSGSVVTLRNLPGSIRFLFDKTCESYGIDIALVDMSPSLGAINQNLVTTSNYFIVPMNPDFFAIMAINSLSKFLPKWKTWSDAARNLPIFREAAYPFPENPSKFIGYIIQKYRPRGGASPSKAFEKWIEDVESSVKNQLLPVLRSSNMIASDQQFSAAGFAPDEPLLQMPDFNALIARSQEHQVPVFELTDQQLDQAGIVLDRTKASMDRFKTLFSDAADRLIKMLDNEKRV
jgi:cellulose biosynthesis protein BcsQ